jgi:hypothetical protein
VQTGAGGKELGGDAAYTLDNVFDETWSTEQASPERSLQSETYPNRGSTPGQGPVEQTKRHIGALVFAEKHTGRSLHQRYKIPIILLLSPSGTAPNILSPQMSRSVISVAASNGDEHLLILVLTS